MLADSILISQHNCAVCFHRKMEEVECDGTENKAEYHDRNGEQKNPAASNTVNVVEGHQGEEEVRECYAERCQCGRAKAYEREYGGAEVH